jgi:Uma2 family endonuclease
MHITHAFDTVLTEYPESDGRPMAENTIQFRWITTIQGGIDALFSDRDDVFVAGDLFWYPIEGDNKTRVAPDVMVVFGRPRRDRGSYMQWREDGIAPQVVFEVLSPGNTALEMIDKLEFYDTFGVEEYYLFDPQSMTFKAWQRNGERYLRLLKENSVRSPRLGLSFGIEGGETLVITRPDGRQFETFVEMYHRAEKERERAEKARERAEHLAAYLRSQGIDPDSI